MVGLPPSARGLTGRPADVAEHASELAREWEDVGEAYVQLNVEDIGPEASRVWAKARLRDRIDAVIAHEHLEAQGIPHYEVVQRASDTELPVAENARKILRSMAEGAKR